MLRANNSESHRPSFRMFGVTFAICVLCVHAEAADNSGGNRGVLMKKKPAETTQPAAPPKQKEPRTQEQPPAQAPAPEAPAPRKAQPREEPPSPATPRPAAPKVEMPAQQAAVPAYWPEGLNAYFGASLKNPTTDDAFAALVGHLNRAMLLGRQPETELAQYEAWMKSFRKNTGKHESSGLQLIDGYYRNLIGWVGLEAQFAAEPDKSLLKQLVKVVQSQATIDPNFDDARRQKIVNTIEQQGLFVPSGILFGYSVLPYRPVTLPKGYVPYEALAKPEFTDTAGRAEATFDFIEAPGPFYRLDFDTLGAARVHVDQSVDGKTFQQVQEWKNANGVRSPIVLAKPFRSRYMRLAVESKNETAVLRNPRVFALKEPPAAIAPLVNEAPELDGSFKEKPWPVKAQIDGFINVETVAFAEAQTTVRICRTDDTLFIAVYAREPRMSTMAASQTAHDAPLWDEESFAILLRPAGKSEFRFVTNPLGAQFDSRDGDDAWDGEWRVATKKWPVGWSAEIAIPFATLGGTPGKEDWELDCIRTRRNVSNEKSVWVYSENPARKEKGLLIF